MSPWLWLGLAAACEVAWVVGLRSISAQRPILSAAIFAAYGMSFVLLQRAVERLPVGPAYAIWTGIGVAGAFVFSLATGERFTAPQAVFAALLVIGTIGLAATTPHP